MLDRMVRVECLGKDADIVPELLDGGMGTRYE
jgi:hypothetical protein